MENIGSAMMLIFDELRKDKASKDLIKKIDKATSDDTLKEGIRESVKRLNELGKNELANDIMKKTKGFAF